MAVPSPLRRGPTVASLLVLTAVSGLVDAVAYLRLGHVFVANMTGNLVFLGLSLDPRSGLWALGSAVAVLGFVVGAFGAGALATRLSRRPVAWLGAAFGAEAGLLALVAVLVGTGVLPTGGHTRYATIALLALGTGLQGGTVRQFGVPGMTTIVQTMTLTGLSADATLAGGPGRRPVRRAGSVVLLAVGAAAGALLVQLSTAAAIGVAAALVGGVATVYVVVPRRAAAPAAPAAPSVPSTPQAPPTRQVPPTRPDG